MAAAEAAVRAISAALPAANAKAAVATIADLNSLELEADVSENNLALVKGGQSCEIQFDALPDSRFRGSIHAIAPMVDRTQATITMKIRFLEKDPRILPEMRAKVSFVGYQKVGVPLTILSISIEALFLR